MKKKRDEQEAKAEEKEKIVQIQDLKRFLQRTCEMAKDNDIEDAIYAVWTTRSSIIITEDFLYFYGSTSKGTWTHFHYGEAIALNKILSIESDYRYQTISLTFADGSERYIQTFDQTKELDRFFKRKVVN